MPPRVTHKAVAAAGGGPAAALTVRRRASVAVSMTALLCSRSLSWQAALACYYALESPGSNGGGSSSGHHTNGSPSNTEHHNHHSNTSPLQPTQRQRQQHALRQRLREADEENDNSGDKSSSCSSSFSMGAGGGGDQATPESVFALYHRLREVGGGTTSAGVGGGGGDHPQQAAASLLLHAGQRQPALRLLLHDPRDAAGTATATTAVHSSDVMNATLAFLVNVNSNNVTAAPNHKQQQQGGSCNDHYHSHPHHCHSGSTEALVCSAHRCRDHNLTSLYARDMVSKAMAPAPSLMESVPPFQLPPRFTGLLELLADAWETDIVLRMRKKSDGSSSGCGGGDVTNTERNTNTEGAEEKEKDLDGEAAVAAATRALFSHGTPSQESSAATTTTAAAAVVVPARQHASVQGAILTLTRDTAAVVALVAQTRMCRVFVQSLSSDVSHADGEEEGEGIENLRQDQREKDALLRLLRCMTKHSAAAADSHVFMALLTEVCDTAAVMYAALLPPRLDDRHRPPLATTGARAAAAAVGAVRADTAALAELLLSSAVRLAAIPADLQRAILTVYTGGVDGTVVVDGAAPWLPLLPPLSISPAVLQAVAGNQHRAPHTDGAWPRLCRAAFLAADAASDGDGEEVQKWRAVLFSVSPAATAGAGGGAPSSPSFPDAAAVRSVFGLDEAAVLRRWSSCALVLAAWLGRTLSSGGSSDPPRVLAAAVARLAVSVAAQEKPPAPSSTLQSPPSLVLTWDGVRRLFLTDFSPSLPSRQEREDLFHETLRAVPPGLARSFFLRCVLHPPNVTSPPAVEGERLAPLGLGTADWLRGLRGHGDGAVVATAAAAPASGLAPLGQEGEGLSRLLRRVLHRWVAAEVPPYPQYSLPSQPPTPHLRQPPMERATLLLADATAALASAEAQGLLASFRAAVRERGARLEAIGSDCASSPAAAVAEARDWIGLMRCVPVGAADEVHLATWLYWTLRAVARADDLLSSRGATYHSAATAFAFAGSDGNGGDVSASEAVATSPPALTVASEESARSVVVVCDAATAMAVAHNLGAHFPLLPPDAIAPPMLLNWLVARVPSLSWGEAAGVLLARQKSEWAKHSRPASDADARVHEQRQQQQPAPFVYLALPLDRIHSMQHALRVLGSLRHVQTDTGTAGDPRAGQTASGHRQFNPSPSSVPETVTHTGMSHDDADMQLLYRRVRQALLHTWYLRSMQAVLAFVAEDPNGRAAATPAAVDTDSAASTDDACDDGRQQRHLHRLLALVAHARTAAAPASSPFALSPVPDGGGGGAIRIPLPVLGMFVLGERQVHAQLLAALNRRNNNSNSSHHFRRESGAAVVSPGAVSVAWWRPSTTTTTTATITESSAPPDGIAAFASRLANSAAPAPPLTVARGRDFHHHHHRPRQHVRETTDGCGGGGRVGLLDGRAAARPGTERRQALDRFISTVQAALSTGGGGTALSVSTGSGAGTGGTVAVPPPPLLLPLNAGLALALLSIAEALTPTGSSTEGGEVPDETP